MSSELVSNGEVLGAIYILDRGNGVCSRKCRISFKLIEFLSAARRLAQNLRRILRRQQGFGHFEIVMVAIGVTLRVDRCRNGGSGARVDEKGFRSDPFGIDDLVFVKENLEVIYITTVLLVHGVAVNQVANPNQTSARPAPR